MPDQVNKQCSSCKREINVSDPHTECIGHNFSCFRDYSYNPTYCNACQQILASYKADDKIAKVIFVERIGAMRRSIRQAIKAGKSLPEEAMERFQLSGGKDVFLDSVKHLDPRPCATRGQTPSAEPTHTHLLLHCSQYFLLLSCQLVTLNRAHRQLQNRC